MIFATVEARYEGTVLWRGGGIDRVLDERHATLLGATTKLLARRQWNNSVEVTYSVYGERGSIDVLAGFPARRIALVIEVKSELTSIEQTARKLDEKVRLASTRLAADRFGWRPVTVGRLLILPATDTARRSVARHAGVLDAVLPARGRIVRSWLREPSGAFAGLLFVADTNRRSPGGGNRGRQRVRVPREAYLERESGGHSIDAADFTGLVPASSTGIRRRGRWSTTGGISTPGYVFETDPAE
jgi:hypothetical protein